MRINTNMAALNAWRNMTVNSGSLQKSLEKLSSGLRINRAADDAAGLAVSEKMQNQIRGTQMAIRNAQDGISLLQTAEGGLSETHSILQRMRELAVQSSTATLQDPDRALLQNEFSQLQGEIDRISKSTQFNGRVLLDGSSGFTATASSASITTVTGTGQTAAGNYTFTTSTTASTATLSFGDVGTGAFASASSTTSTFTAAQTLTVNGKNYAVTNSWSAQNLIDAINADSATSGVSATWDSTNKVITLNATNAGSAYSIAASSSVAPATGGAFATAAASVAASKAQNGGASGSDATITGGTLGNSQYTANGNTITVNSGTAKGLSFTLTAAVSNGSITVGTNGTLDVQIGANISGNDKLSISIKDMGQAALGVQGLSVATQNGASGAVGTIDTAINTVSTQRAQLGAYQNRLEHTVNSLSTASENLSAANSRIRDVDMAQEMANFTKYQILTQASTAMLAQANQSTQGVLSLLR